MLGSYWSGFMSSKSGWPYIFLLAPVHSTTASRAYTHIFVSYTSMASVPTPNSKKLASSTLASCSATLAPMPAGVMAWIASLRSIPWVEVQGLRSGDMLETLMSVLELKERAHARVPIVCHLERELSHVLRTERQCLAIITNMGLEVGRATDEYPVDVVLDTG